MLPDITKYKKGDIVVISATPGDLSPYDIQWCDITLKHAIYCNKVTWVFCYTPEFYDFCFDHFWEFGLSWDKFDLMVKEKIGLRSWSEKCIKTNHERYQELQERRLEIHHQKCLNFQDFELKDRQKNQNEIRLAEIMYRNRLGVLARLDKRHRDKLEIEGNISESLAKVIIARKNKEAEE